MGGLRCPRCDEPLKDSTVVKHFRPPLCPRLDGLYLDRWHVTHQFEDDEQRLLRTARDAAPEGGVACPGCATRMRVLVVGEGVEIDGCTACGGYWFDFGELETLRQGGISVAVDGEAAAPKGLRALALRLQEAFTKA